MSSSKAEFDRLGIAIVVISFAQPAKLIRYQQYHNWPFIMLADPDRTLYRAFDLPRLSWFRVFSPSTLRLYLKLLREGNRIQDHGKDDYHQAGGDFLIDNDGAVLFAYRSREPSDRPTTPMLLGEIARIQERRARNS